MSMKKAIDQTIRDLKREVNKKVLKVPSIEQKVLDATSNEPWGPHGSLLADIAQASRNYHEYQMIMAVIWKRINDTGKNWRHVYKALIILEYMVAHGSERVIDDIREHAYQISTLSNFQYIDSSGRDQGNNVRRKSQSLVLLVNDKDRIQEVRQKAAANRDKFRNSSAMGGMYRPSPYSSSGGYGDDRYDGSYEERNGYGREREWGYRDDGSYGYGNSYSREGDRYGRESEERYGRDSYRDDDYHYRSRSKSSDRYGDRDHAYDADDHHSSRGSSVKADDHSQGGRPIERKFSEQNLAAPPSYEEVVGDSRSPAYSERDGETPATLAPKSSSPTATSDASPTTADQGSSSNANQQADSFDEFDPRGSVSAAPTTTAVHATSAAPTMAAVHATSAAPTTSNNAEMDLLGSLSESFSPPPLAIVPVSSGPAASEVGIAATNPEPSFMAVTSATTSVNQSFEDPFGDMPFKATSFDEVSAQPQNFNSTASFESTMNNFEQTQPVAQNLDTVSNLNCGDTFPSTASSSFPNAQTSPNSQFLPQEPPSNSDGDILAGILPPSGPSVVSQAAFSTPSPQPFGMPSFMPQSQHSSPNPYQLSVSASAVNSNIGFQIPAAPATQQNDDFLGGLLSQVGSTVPSSSRAAGSSSAGPLVLVPQQPHNEKFEPKSAVWADTLSRGLVNLNISGAKVNPLADIGIDFESLNRKEKRMEKPSTAPASSNITMGKAMGSGSGMGRASAGTFRPPSNTMMGSGMGMSMGGGPGMSMGGGPGMPMAMGSYGAVNHQMGMGMGMGMNPGMVMNPGMMPSGSNMGGYNPMMGRGGYPPQPPYGGGYR